MDRENSPARRGRHTLPYLWLVLAVLLTALICGMSVTKLRQDLYEERAYNSCRVMNKISVFIQTVMETRSDHVRFDAGLVAGREFSDAAGAAAFLGKLEETGRTGADREVLLLIDSKGDCLASDGTVFHWEEGGALHTGEPAILLSSVNALGRPDEQMLFLAPLPRAVPAGDRDFTHLCLVMDQSVMGRYLAKANYVPESALFIIQRDGNYIYKQTEGSPFSGVFNLLAKLEKWDYLYQTSAGRTVREIEDEVSGCACVSVDGESYFVVHESLHVNGWTAVYLVPEKGASANSPSFMSEVIRTVVVLAAIVMCVVLGFILANHFYSMRQQKLVHEQLQRAAEAERSANNAKTRFLSSMSHDIRTPMNAILGMTTIAEKHIDDAEYVKDCLAKIHLSSNHLLTLINDILDISKIETGKMTLSPAVFSLHDAIDDLFHIVRPQARAKNQILDVRIEKLEHEYLLADELRLSQIFINLLTNAIKYTPEAGRVLVTIREELSREQDGAVALVYTVRDNGIGMSEEFMADMYGSFTRATDTRVNKIQGTGLGLAICKQLVDLMDGSIECESALGEGTTFTVTLSLPAAEPPAKEFRLPELDILLADDDEAFRIPAAEMLREMGARVETASSGREAVSKAAARHQRGEDYSAVLMDWKMSGMDGIETTKQLRACVDKRLPVILISAYDSTDIEEAAAEAGAVGFIRKPFFKAALHQQLNEYLHLDHGPAPEDEGELAGMRVLVAEDNDLNWEIAQELLDMSGVSAERAENGRLCVNRLLAAADGEFDAVLMDVQMPVMDGREAAREIRKLERAYLRELPIIAMTADAFAEDVRACLEAGMDSHIPKPIDPDRLSAELRKVRHKKR